MENFINSLKVPTVVGITAALGGGLINYIAKVNTTVSPNLNSMVRNFILVTTAATVVEYGRKEDFKKSIER